MQIMATKATSSPIVKNFKSPGEPLRSWVDRYKVLNPGISPSNDELEEAGFHGIYIKLPTDKPISSATDEIASWCKEMVPLEDYLFKFFGPYVAVFFTEPTYIVAMRLVLAEKMIGHEFET